MEESNSIWLYGAGGHALVVIDALKSMSCSIAGVFDDRFPIVFESDIPTYQGFSDPQFVRPTGPMIITIGNWRIRKQLVERLGGPFANALAPSAIVSKSVRVGIGSVILHGSIIQANSVIGNHSIINTGASIDHECTIDDFVHISPQATLCGDVCVGEGSWIGAGAVVIPGVKIGRGVTIGAGAVVIRDVPDGLTVVGNPAREIARLVTENQETRGCPQNGHWECNERYLPRVVRQINQVLKNSGKPAFDQIGGQHRLRQDLGLDSLELAEMTVRLEAEFGVDVFRDGLVGTVGDVCDRLQVLGGK